ncbi:MAG: hypothetical protein IKJ01_00530 [Lachnospiraceae bacterium]|nr:hypothetical protein [Lachnospiraceae bacterium]
MKRQISICIFLAIIVILLSLLFIKFNNTRIEYNKQQELLNTQNVQQQESIRISQPYTQYMFYILNENGQLVVYDTKTNNLYMETGIRTDYLPEEVQKEIKEGLFFQTESDLYDFLESYSS